MTGVLLQGMGGGPGWGQQQQQQHLEDLYVMAAEGKLTRYQLSSPQLGSPVSSPELLGTPTQSVASPRYSSMAPVTVLRLRPHQSGKFATALALVHCFKHFRGGHSSYVLTPADGSTALFPVSCVDCADDTFALITSRFVR